MERLKLCIKNNYKESIVFFFFFVINCILIKKTDIQANYKVIIISISALLEIFLCFFLKVEKIEKFAVIFLAIFGILYCIFIPFSRTPDEYAHFLRAYEISQGHLLSEQDPVTKAGGREYPSSFEKIKSINNYEELLEKTNELPSDEKEFIAFSNTALYSFICYIPQALGIFIGSLFNLPMIYLGYLGRIFNLAVYLLITYIAIKYIPFKKVLLAFMIMVPISIQESISLSPDALTNSSAFALIAYVLYLKYTKKGFMNRKDFILVSVITAILAMCKIVYLPFCLLVFMIPKERFKSKKQKYIYILSLAFFVCLLNISWTLTASKFLNANINGSNSSEQIKFILTEPFEYIKIFLTTLIEKSGYYIKGVVGRYLGNFDIFLGKVYVCLNIVILLVLLIVEDKIDSSYEIEKKDRVLITFCSLIVVALIFTSVYIQWNSLKFNYIEGVQGRYFIPLIPALGVCALNKKLVLKKDIKFTSYLFIIMVFENVSAIYEIISKFCA